VPEQDLHAAREFPPVTALGGQCLGAGCCQLIDPPPPRGARIPLAIDKAVALKAVPDRRRSRGRSRRLTGNCAAMRQVSVIRTQDIAPLTSQTDSALSVHRHDR
jgi:hypothetical protein